MIFNTNPIHLQIAYTSRLSYLRNFKRRNTTHWNFSCPICGDSQLQSFKARGNIYEGKHGLAFHCFNCGSAMSLPKFLKEINPSLYGEYQLDLLKDRGAIPNVTTDKDLFRTKRLVFAPNWQSYFTSIDSLPNNHTAVKYISNRKMPKDQWHRLFYTDGYADSIKQLGAALEIDLGEIKVPNDPRLVLPFLDANHNINFVQGRALDENPKIRYTTTKISDDIKLFGLETIDVSKDIYVTEGPIDSLFLPNAVATADADLSRASYVLPKDNLILIFDNEPRSHIACKKIKTAIERGFRVVIFPECVTEKDINAMVLSGSFQLNLLEQFVFSGMRAMVEFGKWKKI